MYGCVALDRESVAKTPYKRRYCTDICNPCHESRGPHIIQQYSLFSSSRYQAVHIETIMTNDIVVAIVIDLYA